MTTYKITSDHPEEAFRILLNIMGEYPGRKIGNGVFVASMVAPKKCVAFYVYRRNTMWVIVEDNAMESAP